jgi:uncharacterized membrane protein
MNPQLNDWLNLILRWAHVFASIMWVGATFFFTWLDGRFTELEEKAKKNPDDKNPEKHVWMVHSGGFYLVEKQKNPQLMPQMLHWFKWEAAITWITGIFLFGLVYYHGGLMVEFEDWPISKGAAIGMSLGFIAAGWAIYDLLWKFVKNEIAGIAISFVLIAICAFVFLGGATIDLFGAHLLLHPWHALFPTRAAFMQLGVMLGTIMAANVWMRILPPQRRMVAALKAGLQPDLAKGAQAKTRSKHNTFIVFPVVFIMISNHYPGTYGSPHNWLILCAMVLLGWGAAIIIRRA